MSLRPNPSDKAEYTTSRRSWQARSVRPKEKRRKKPSERKKALTLRKASFIMTELQKSVRQSSVEKSRSLVERARLEIVYTPKGYRGFESLLLRQRKDPSVRTGLSFVSSHVEGFEVSGSEWRAGGIPCANNLRVPCPRAATRPARRRANPSFSATESLKLRVYSTIGGPFLFCQKIHMPRSCFSHLPHRCVIGGPLITEAELLLYAL